MLFVPPFQIYTMPRTYQRKTDHGLVSQSHDAMEETVKIVLSGMTVRKVAKDKGISRSALSRYVKKYEEDPTAVLAPNYRHSQSNVHSGTRENVRGLSTDLFANVSWLYTKECKKVIL